METRAMGDSLHEFRTVLYARTECIVRQKRFAVKYFRKSICSLVSCLKKKKGFVNNDPSSIETRTIYYYSPCFVWKIEESIEKVSYGQFVIFYPHYLVLSTTRLLNVMILTNISTNINQTVTIILV